MAVFDTYDDFPIPQTWNKTKGKKHNNFIIQTQPGGKKHIVNTGMALRFAL